ncbi:MAG: metallopeptidase TldD-related protein [Nitrospira sp.]|nr:metallopeptidase TldD-related protein [Nitrospira sp.]
MHESPEVLKILAAELIDRVKVHGATEADVMVAEGDSLSVQVRLAAVDRLSKAREKSLGIRVFFGKRSASASTSDFSESSLKQLVTDTCALAKAVAEDETSGLPEQAAMATDVPDLDLYDPTTMPVEEAIDVAQRAERAALDVDPRVTNSEGAECDSAYGAVVLANTHGFLGYHRSSRFSLSVAPVVEGPDDQGMQRDYWYTVSRKRHELEGPESIGRIAAERTLRRLGARKVGTQRVPVIFDPETAGSVLGHLASAVSGYSLYKGASFLLGQLGKPIASQHVNVEDNGCLPGKLGSRPFDGEGLPTRKTMILEQGVLANYLLDTYSGRKLGMTSTGNASRSIGDNPTVSPSNLFFHPGEESPDEIIQSVTQGLYVTELIGFGVNVVTGDYSRGASGFWIENGELAYPVEEVTISGNLKQMFQDIESIGNDLVFRGKLASPTIRIREMMVGGH